MDLKLYAKKGLENQFKYKKLGGFLYGCVGKVSGPSSGTF
jgi:hypothetical protein